MRYTIQTDRLVRHFMDLVAIDSPTCGERQMADRLTADLRALGFTVEEDDAAVKLGGNAGNLYGYLPGREDLPPLLLSAHMDTVAPAFGKRAILEPDGTIHSAGDTVLGSDDLGGAAAILEAVRALEEAHCPHRSVEVVFSAAEESYCQGASLFDWSRVRSREAYVLDCEGAPGEAVVAAPTILDFSAEIRGRAAHAGFAPESGVHAILTAARAMTAARSGRISPHTTVNFGLIEGGAAVNIIPDRCVVRGEIRSDDHALAEAQLAEVRETFAEACRSAGAELVFDSRYFLRAYQTPEEAPVVRRYFRVCAQRGHRTRCVRTFGGSDNNVLALHGIQGIVMPSAMHKCHSLEEHTSAAELTETAAIVAELLLSED